MMKLREMALVPCRECGAKISDKAPRCPNCGAPVTPPAGERAKDVLLLAFIVVVVVASCWTIVAMTIGTDNALRWYATTFHRPLDLKEETVSIPRDELRGVLVEVPYGGNATIDVRSLGPEQVDMHVIPGVDLLRLANAKPPFAALKLNEHPAFAATAAPAALRAGHLAAGSYVIVLEHARRGAPTSDARVQVRLAP